MNNYLVLYDYGSGGLWAVLKAESKQKILETIPKLQILDTRPSWMTEQNYQEILKETGYSIDSIPVDSWLSQIN